MASVAPARDLRQPDLQVRRQRSVGGRRPVQAAFAGDADEHDDRVPDVDAGKTAYYRFRFVNTKGELGPLGMIYYATIMK